MRFFNKSLGVALVAALIACNDEDAPGPSIVLTIVDISDSKRLLKWEEVENAKVYNLSRSVRRNGVLKGPVLIASVDFLSLSYVDESLPLASEIEYYVETTINGRQIKSNVVSSSGATYLPILPYQMKLLPDKNLAVVRDYRSIFLVDYEEQVIVARREFSGKLGGFDLGNFNGQKEMYLPSTDHNIYIMDPYDLSMIDTLIGSYPVHSVAVNSKGMIYYSCSDWQAPLKLYDRATMTFISQHAGESNSGILLKSDTDLVAISSGLSPATMSYYTFNREGGLLSKSDDPYHWDYEMDSERVKMSSQYIVTSTGGFVYNADASLTHVTTLSNGYSTMTDFEFSEDGGTIYSAVSNAQHVNKHVINGSASSITTIGYPWMLIRNGDELIVLSSPEAFSPWNITNRVIVERIPLK